MRPLAALLTVLALSAGAVAAPVTLTTEENAPFNYTDPATGQLSGVAVEKVQEVMRRAGIEYRIQLLPWTDAYRQAQEDQDTCVFLTNWTEERDPLFQWVMPLLSGGWGLFSRPDWKRHLNTPQDLAGLRIGMQGGSALERYIRSLIDEGVAINPVPMTGTLDFAPLLDGSIDLLAGGIWNGIFVARMSDVRVKLVYRLTSSVGALACNKAMDPGQIAHMRKALDSMVKDGSFAAIDARYNPPSTWSRGMSR